MADILPAMTGAWVWREHACTALDEQVSALERKWGVDRLPRLVSPELATRFRQAADLHAAEAPYADPPRLAELDAMMARAWAALDADATSRGAEPLPPACFEVDSGDPARGVIVIALDNTHAQALALRAKQEGRRVETWTLAEVAAVMRGHAITAAVKAAFPGAGVREPELALEGEGA